MRNKVVQVQSFTGPPVAEIFVTQAHNISLYRIIQMTLLAVLSKQMSYEENL
jgi:hypothetical protein